MKHWSGLVYLAIGIAIGLLVGASITGFAAGGDREPADSNALARYEIVAVPLDDGGAYAFVLDRQTGRAYSRYRSGSASWESWYPVGQGDE